MDLPLASAATQAFVALDAFGVTVGVRISGDCAGDLRASLVAAWSRCLAHEAMPEVELDVQVNGPHQIAEAMSVLTSNITLAAIGARAGTLMMLHAGAVADPDGGVWGLVAPSGTGKTTAATRLAERFGYVTDETLAVTFSGSVLAYPKPLSVGVPGTVKAQVSPDALGLARAPSALRLAGLVLLDRDGHLGSPWQATRLGVLEACALMVPHTSFLSKVPAPLDVLVELVQSVGGVTHLRYRDSSELAGALKDLGMKQ